MWKNCIMMKSKSQKHIVISKLNSKSTLLLNLAEKKKGSFDCTKEAVAKSDTFLQDIQRHTKIVMC